MTTLTWSLLVGIGVLIGIVVGWIGGRRAGLAEAGLEIEALRAVSAVTDDLLKDAWAKLAKLNAERLRG